MSLLLILTLATFLLAFADPSLATGLAPGTRGVIDADGMSRPSRDSRLGDSMDRDKMTHEVMLATERAPA